MVTLGRDGRVGGSNTQPGNRRSVAEVSKRRQLSMSKTYIHPKKSFYHSYVTAVDSLITIQMFLFLLNLLLVFSKIVVESGTFAK